MNTLEPGDEGAAAFVPLSIETPGQNTSFHTSEVLDARFAINASNIEELFYDMVCFVSNFNSRVGAKVPLGLHLMQQKLLLNSCGDWVKEFIDQNQPKNYFWFLFLF